MVLYNSINYIDFLYEEYSATFTDGITSIVELDSEASKKWGGKTMVIAPPIDYDKLNKYLSVTYIRFCFSLSL